MSAYLKLLRPHQYIKNGFVFLGVMFAGQWGAETLSIACIAFVSFCAISSAIYIMNDLIDVKVDRLHPVKKKRAIASGAVKESTAKIVGITLAIGALVLASLVHSNAVMFILAYGLLNIGYSLKWKHIPVLDVFIISSGFMLRILMGTIGIGIAPSSWLLLCGMMLTLFLGFSKRRAELLTIESSEDNSLALTRSVLGNYNPQVIEQFMSISAACAIITYSLYTVSSETISRHGTDALIYTVPFVIYGIFRYVFILHNKGRGNDTAKDLYTDGHLLFTVLSWIAATVWIIG